MTVRDWVCCDSRLPEEFGCYDVTVESSYHDVRFMNVAYFRPVCGQWDLLLDKEDLEGFRVIAWRDRGKCFEWSDLK